MRFPILKHCILSLVGSFFILSASCSTPSKDTDDDDLTADDSDEPAQAADAKSTDEAADDLSLDDTTAPVKPATDAKTLDAKAPEALASSDKTPLPATVLPAVPMVPAPALSSDASERVVRYVMADGTLAYSQADEKSTQVGTYEAGDPVVVKITGEWAELTDSYFIKASALSSSVVPRKRSDPWMPANPSAR